MKRFFRKEIVDRSRGKIKVKVPLIFFPVMPTQNYSGNLSDIYRGIPLGNPKG